MKLSIEYEVFENGTAALEVDGTRIAYIKPVGDGNVEITIVPYNEFGLSPIRQPRFKVNLSGVKRRHAAKRRSVQQTKAEAEVA